MNSFVNFVSAVIICTSADRIGKSILEALDSLELAKDHNTLSILMDIGNLPSWIYALNEINELPSYSFVPRTIDALQQANFNFNYLSNITDLGKKYILFFTETSASDEELKSAFNKTLDEFLVRNIRLASSALQSRFSPLHKFALLDFKDDDTLRCLISVTRDNLTDNFAVLKISTNLEEWVLKHKDEECFNCNSEFTVMMSVVIILATSSLFVTLLIGIGALARYHVLKKRVAKGPYKVLLTATDFVFPQIPDSRRVS